MSTISITTGPPPRPLVRPAQADAADADTIRRITASATAHTGAATADAGTKDLS